MGSIQSKIRQSYCFAQKPCLKKKSQKSTNPSCTIPQRGHAYRKNSEIKYGEATQLENLPKTTSFPQLHSFQSPKTFSTDANNIPDQDYFPASAIGLVQSTIGQQVHFGVGSLVSSNIVLTTAHHLYSQQNKKEALQIKFLLNDGISQEKFDVEKSYISQSYRNWNKYSQQLHGKIFLQDYAILVLKTHVDIEKYGLLGYDFSQRNNQKESNILLYGFNHRNNALKMENIRLKARLAEENICYNTFYSFTVPGGPIIAQQEGNYTIIGIQNCSNHQNSLTQQKSLRLNEKMFNEIAQEITKQEQQIDLRDKSLGKEGLKKLVKQQKASLSHINISRNKIGIDGLKYLTKCEWNNLHHLDIGGNEIKKEGVQHLIKIPMKNLLCLNMWGNSICSQGACLLLEADWKHLSSINLYNNSICNEGIKSLIKAKWEELQSINLGKNCINENIIPSFQYSVWKNIVSLNLWGNQIKNCKEIEGQLKRLFPNIKYIFL